MASKMFNTRDKANVKWFWREYLKGKTPWIALILALIVVQGFVYQQFLVFTESGLRVIFEAGQVADLLLICGFVVLAFGMRAIVSFVVPVVSARITGAAILELRRDLIRKVVYLNQSYFDKTSSGDVILRLVSQVDGVGQFVGQTTVNALRDALTIIIVAAYLIYKSAILFFAAVVVLPIIFLVLKWVSERVRQFQTQTEDVIGNYITGIDEMTGGIRTIKMSNQEQTEIDRLSASSGAIKSLYVHLHRSQAMILPAIDMSSAFVFVLVIGGGGYMVLSDLYTLDGAAIIAFILGMVIIFDPARSLSQFFTRLQASLVLLDSLKTLNDTVGEGELDAGKEEFSADTVEIALENVSFGYHEDTPIFSDLSLLFEAGKKTAIVGSTGSGKTTILSLMSRLYEVNEGQVSFNGHDGRRFTKSSLRSQFSVVAQDVVIFNSSVADNIRYANPSASDAQVLEAAKLARIDALLIERGDSPVGPKGSQLSGGQKQRIAIARAFLNPSPVLILDEATSALDALTEKHVNEAFAELQKGKTTIVVTHKFSSVLDADKIYVLEAGRLVEEGTHDDFMQGSSLYKTMFEAQMKDEKKGPE